MKIDLTITRDKPGLNIVGKNEEHLSFDFPTSWQSVTFEQYLARLDCGADIIKIVALFTGLDVELIRKAQIHNLGVIIACLDFMKKPIQYPVPLKILGYPVPPNLETESIAQYADLQTIAAAIKEDDPKGNRGLFPLICATYAVKPYDYLEAEKIAPKFLKAACTEVLAVGNFTLVRLDALNQGIVPTSPPVATTKTRFRLAMSDWLQNSVSTLRYYSWKRSLPLQERNYLNGLSRTSNSI